MTKILKFPNSKSENVTWGEAMQAMLDNADEKTKNTPIRNMLIVSESDKDYSFGLLNDKGIRNMLGTMECIKNYFIFVLQTASDYEHPSGK